MEQRFITLPTGVRLAYVEHGSPDGIPVVMLHGVTDSWRSFEPLLAHLPASLHVFAIRTLRFKVMGEAYNLTNRVNYTAYQGNIRSALFNQPTAAGRPRSFQLGAQFDF